MCPLSAKVNHFTLSICWKNGATTSSCASSWRPLRRSTGTEILCRSEITLQSFRGPVMWNSEGPFLWGFNIRQDSG
jgi:hypothetical protein